MPIIAFDFDGTIADSMQIMINNCNKVLEEEGIEPVSEDEARDKTMKEIIKSRKIWFWKIPGIVKRTKQYASFDMENAKLQPGLKKALLSLQNNYSVIIVSSNNERVIRTVLNNHGISCETIHGDLPLFKKKRLLKKIDPDVYVGDEARDVKAAKKAKVKSIAVTWGKDSKDKMQDADFIVDTAEELVEVCNNLFTPEEEKAEEDTKPHELRGYKMERGILKEE